MANVYTVRGSEDGIIAVFANVKGAVKRAYDYASQSNTRELEMTEAEYAKEVRASGHCYMIPSDTQDQFATSEVDLFELER